MRARIMRDFVAGQAVQAMIAADKGLVEKFVKLGENSYRGMQFLESLEGGVSVKLAARQWLFIESDEDLNRFLDTDLGLYALDVEAQVSRKVHKRAIADSAAEKVLAQRHPDEWKVKTDVTINAGTDAVIRETAKALAASGLDQKQVEAAIAKMVESLKGQ